MKTDFLLKSELAKRLFNEVKDLPIIDYHCHLDPMAIAENRRFKNISELALKGDHYKWRLMRACGIDEKYITGDANDFDKFFYFCKTIENCIGSPIYHWTCLEMQRYFNYDGIINAKNAQEIYDHCNKIINDDFSVWDIFKKFKIELIGTTDDPIDSLEYHKIIAENKELPRVLPTFRPSQVLDIEKINFTDYINRLGNISSWDSLLAVLSEKIDFFDKMGCVSSDHSLEPPVFDRGSNVNNILKKALSGDILTQLEINIYKTELLIELGSMYKSKNWVMQLHMGAQRNNNTNMFNMLGADTGFDAISDCNYSKELALLLDSINNKSGLPKTVLYALNPNSDIILSVLAGCFTNIQLGAPWWFNDTKQGIIKHLNLLAQTGVVSNFIGMLTDSRSFMSYPRHEYFRRILCQTIATWVDDGEFPDDFEKISEIVRKISYENISRYLK